MAKINLIPWREELRKQKKRDFLNAIALSIMVTVASIVLILLFLLLPLCSLSAAERTLTLIENGQPRCNPACVAVRFTSSDRWRV